MAAPRRRRRPRGPRTVRAGDRGGARGHGHQARPVRAPLARHPRAGLRDRLEHLVDPDHRARRTRRSSRAVRRPALLQPRTGDAPGRGDRRRADGRACARGRARHRRRDGQARDRRHRRARLPRQPLRAPVRPRGAARRPGGSCRRGDRRSHRAPRRRLSHGPVRAAGPRRHRHGTRGREELLRAELRGAALAPVDAERADGRQRPARAQDRHAAGTPTRRARSSATRIPSRPSQAARWAWATGSW